VWPVQDTYEINMKDPMRHERTSIIRMEHIYLDLADKAEAQPRL
jgi:hypothetical protein